MHRTSTTERVWPRAVVRALVCAVIGGVALSVALPVPAEPGPITTKEAEAQRVIAEINDLNSSLNKTVEAYNAATWRLGEAVDELKRNRSELVVVRRNLSRAQSTLAARVVDLYTADSSSSTLEVLLGATSLDDLMNRIDTNERVASQNAHVVGDVTTYRDRAERRERRLEQLRGRLEALVAERAAQRAAIQTQLGERQQLLSSIRDEITRLKAAERAREIAAARAARARLAASRTVAQSTATPPAPQASAPPPVASSSSTPAAPSRYGGVVGIAMRYLGVPYVWGGASPSGFDCSGFTMYVYAQIGVSLPHYTGAQYALGSAVSREELQPGDLVFFDGLGHEGIYIGGNQFIHAPHTGDVVKISSISGWYSATWAGARRL